MFCVHVARAFKSDLRLLNSIVKADDERSFRQLWNQIPRGQLVLNLRRDRVGCDRDLMLADSPEWTVHVLGTKKILQFVNEQTVRNEG